MENLQLFEGKTAEKISYSKLNLYLQCPRRYKMAYIEGNSHLIAPENMIIGTKLHHILYSFYSSLDRSYEYLESIIERNFTEPWQSRVKSIFHNYYRDNDMMINPLFLEKGFKTLFAGQILIGKFDRVDKVNNEIEIIDYKFGETTESKTFVTNSLQWIFYWIAFERAFSDLGTIKSFTYYFLNQNKKVTIRPTQTEYNRAKKNLLEKITIMTNDEIFKPQKNKRCDDCLFRDSCELWTN